VRVLIVDAAGQVTARWRALPWCLGAGLLSLALPLAADTVTARCDVYPRGEDHTDNSGPCRFSQRQGFVTISRQDGVTHQLQPQGGRPGNYIDEQGRPVYRNAGLGTAGQIYRFPDESVYVYWTVEEPDPADRSSNPTWPYTTADYDATTLLPCRVLASGEAGLCPAGILRMEGGEASIVVTSPRGEEFTFNFLHDVVNATNREVKAELRGDTWQVTVDGAEYFEVPMAAITGG
jgi:hypothetical protein